MQCTISQQLCSERAFISPCNVLIVRHRLNLGDSETKMGLLHVRFQSDRERCSILKQCFSGKLSSFVRSRMSRSVRNRKCIVIRQFCQQGERNLKTGRTAVIVIRPFFTAIICVWMLGFQNCILRQHSFAFRPFICIRSLRRSDSNPVGI